MSTKKLNGVTNFIEELKKRREIVSTSSNLNLNTNDYTTMKELISSCFSKSIQEVTYDDMYERNKDTLRKILELIGLDSNSIDDLLNNLTEQPIAEKVQSLIEKYIVEYENIQQSQQEMQKTKLDLYDKYLKIFSSEPLSSLFEDFDELKKLIFNLGLSKEEELDIQTFIANKNIEYSKKMTKDADSLSKINGLTEKYCDPTSSIFNQILEILKGKDIDLELIPELATELSRAISIPESLAANTVCSIVLSNLYEEKEDNKSLIDQVLGYTYSKDKIVEETSRNILKDSMDLVSKTLFLGNDGMQYIDSSIQDIMNEENISYDAAVDNKSIAIIKVIAETLDKLETLNPKDGDYSSAIGLLDELNTSYFSITNKKKNTKVVGFKRRNTKPAKAKAA